LLPPGFLWPGFFFPASILPQGSVATEAAHIFAMYAAARTIPLAILVLTAIFKKSCTTLIVLGILAGAIQFLDAFVGVYQHDVGKAAGPFVIACVQFYAILRLRKPLI